MKLHRSSLRGAAAVLVAAIFLNGTPKAEAVEPWTTVIVAVAEKLASAAAEDAIKRWSPAQTVELTTSALNDIAGVVRQELDNNDVKNYVALTGAVHELVMQHISTGDQAPLDQAQGKVADLCALLKNKGGAKALGGYVVATNLYVGILELKAAKNPAYRKPLFNMLSEALAYVENTRIEMVREPEKKANGVIKIESKWVGGKDDRKERFGWYIYTPDGQVIDGRPAHEHSWGSADGARKDADGVKAHYIAEYMKLKEFTDPLFKTAQQWNNLVTKMAKEGV